MADFWPLPLQIRKMRVTLHRVFHSIRFKVNKVGIQRYPIFFTLLLYALTAFFVPLQVRKANNSKLNKYLQLWHS